MITIDARWLNASGIGTYIRNIVPGLIRALPSDRFTLLGNPQELDLLDFGDRSRIHLVSAHSAMYSIGEQFEIPRLIPKDTRLFFSPHYPIPLGHSTKYGKLLVTVHDVIHLARPQWFGSLHKQLYAKLMFKTVSRKADAIIAVSEFTKSEINRYLSIDSNKIHVIPHGVDESWFNLPIQANPHPRPYILFVGNVKPNKNLANLVRAFSQLIPIIPHDLVIIGKHDGFQSRDEEVHQLAQAHPDRIFFTGFVNSEELKSYMSHASIFVFPSFYEGFGLPPLEAMAAGIPTLVSDAASIPEVCGDASSYFDPNNVDDIAIKIKSLVNDPPLQLDLKLRGIARAKEFTWDSAIEKTASLVHQMVAT
jgi:glycosyltransferase involved in cell wall biosynthesis